MYTILTTVNIDRVTVDIPQPSRSVDVEGCVTIPSCNHACAVQQRCHHLTECVKASGEHFERSW